MTGKPIHRRALALTGTALVVALCPAVAAAAPPVPSLAWTSDCPDVPKNKPVPSGYQCATVAVPLSYADPGGATISLSLGRLRATDPARRVGTIFTATGYPSSQGRLPPELTPALRARFDIIGFDPRGTGKSSPMTCFRDTAEAAPLFENAKTRFPVTLEQERRTVANVAKVSELCGRAGEIRHHLSASNVARDLDLLRQATGEPKLAFYGQTFGTQLGMTYANLFPARIGALALDSAEDPVAWTTGHGPAGGLTPLSYRLGSHLGAERALESFLDSCAHADHCAFREPGTDLLAKYHRVLDRLLANPVSMTYQQAVGTVKQYLTDASSSPRLGEFLHALETGVKPATPPAMPDPNEIMQIGAVACTEATNPSNPHWWYPFGKLADLDARGFGTLLTYDSLGCATLPVADPGRYTGPWNRRRANTALLIGSLLGDPDTPYDGVLRAAAELGNSRVLALNSWGNGARNKSACVDGALDRYFTGGTVPPAGTVCEPDHAPFDGADNRANADRLSSSAGR